MKIVANIRYATSMPGLLVQVPNSNTAITIARMSATFVRTPRHTDESNWMPFEHTQTLTVINIPQSYCPIMCVRQRAALISAPDKSSDRNSRLVLEDADTASSRNIPGVNAGIDAYQAALMANKKVYAQHTYEGTQHGFHNDTTPRCDEAAAKLAWTRTVEWFHKQLR